MGSFQLNFSQKALPEDTTWLTITDRAHLLSSVSPSALMRADGWKEGATQIERTLGKFETIMAANENRFPEALAA